MFAGIPPVSSPDKPTPAESSSAEGPFASAMHGAVGAKSAYGANNAESVPLRSVLLPMLSDDSMRKVMEAAGGRELTLSPMEQYALDVVRNLRENGIFVTNAGDAVLTPDPETARILGGLIANYPFDRPRQDRPFPDVYPPDHFAANLERYFNREFVDTVRTWVENHNGGNLPGEGSPFFRPTR